MEEEIIEEEIIVEEIVISEPTSTSDEWDEFGDHCCF
jgi:hypothetical protein